MSKVKIMADQPKKEVEFLTDCEPRKVGHCSGFKSKKGNSGVITKDAICIMSSAMTALNAKAQKVGAKVYILFDPAKGPNHPAPEGTEGAVNEEYIFKAERGVLIDCNK